MFLQTATFHSSDRDRLVKLVEIIFFMSLIINFFRREGHITKGSRSVLGYYRRSFEVKCLGRLVKYHQQLANKLGASNRLKKHGYQAQNRDKKKWHY